MAAIGKIKKGDTVILCAFTGMKLGVKEVVGVSKDTITISTDKGELVFDRKTLKQVEPQAKAPRFANSIIEDDGSYVPPTHKKKATKKKAAHKKAETKVEAKEEEETPAPKKAAKKKPVTKKKPEPQPEPEEDDEDEDEEWDDDDFEEVE